MLKGKRTVIFNVLAAILPVLEVSGADLGLEGDALAIYALAITVFNVILRGLTNTPVFKK